MSIATSACATLMICARWFRHGPTPLLLRRVTTTVAPAASSAVRSWLATLKSNCASVYPLAVCVPQVSRAGRKLPGCGRLPPRSRRAVTVTAGRLSAARRPESRLSLARGQDRPGVGGVRRLSGRAAGAPGGVDDANGNRGGDTEETRHGVDAAR